MKKTPIFRGAGTAIITPFRDGEIDFDSFAGIVEDQIAAGIASASRRRARRRSRANTGSGSVARPRAGNEVTPRG